MKLKIAALVALTCTLGYAAFQKAGVDPGDWNGCLLAIGIIAGIYGALSRSAEVGRLDRVTAICLVTILGLAVLQLVPLPIGVVRQISPMRFELWSAATRLIGDRTHTLTLTATPYETAEYLLTLSGYALVILLIRHLTLQLKGAAWMAIWPLLIVSGLEAALGCYQAYAGTGDVKGTYVNRDHFAVLLEMALPFALAYPIAVLRRDNGRHESATRPSIKACVAISIFVLLLAGIVFSLCRMAFVASLTAIFVVLAAVVSTRNRQDGPQASVRQWRRLVAVGGLAIIVFLGFIYLPTDALVARFADLAGSEISANERVQIWHDTTLLIKDYPVFGCGLGSYGSCFLRYKTVAPMGTVDYAHNDYMQVLAEFGVFGFAAGFVFVIGILLRTIRGALHARSPDDRFIAIACLGAMTAILLHSFVDFNMYVPANGFEFAWILGVAVAQGGSRRRKTPEQLTDSSRLVFSAG